MPVVFKILPFRVVAEVSIDVRILYVFLPPLEGFLLFARHHVRIYRAARRRAAHHPSEDLGRSPGRARGLQRTPCELSTPAELAATLAL
jgi:hypothetical protein